MLNNQSDGGLFVYGSNVDVIGGTVSSNKGHGVVVDGGGKVTVAAAEHTENVDRPQTVSTGNTEADWATKESAADCLVYSDGQGEIVGLAEGIHVVAV